MSWLQRWWWRGALDGIDAAAAREQQAKLRAAERETPWFEEHGPSLLEQVGTETFVARVRAAMSLSKRTEESP